MGIIVLNPSKKFTTEMLIDAAIGQTDERGNPFQLITLDWNPDLKNAHLAKSRGFEDALIERQSRGLKIVYRRPGCAVWMLNELTMTYSAKIPYTKHNMAVLGSHFGDGLWNIRELTWRNQAGVIYEGIRKAMNPRQREEDNKRQKGHHISMYEKVEDMPDLRDFASKPENSHLMNLQERAELVKLQKEVAAKAQKLKEQQEWMEAKIADLQRRGVVLNNHSEESLEAMGIAEVRNAAKEAGIKWKPRMGKDELIAAIMKQQYNPVSGEDGEGESEGADVNSTKTAETVTS